ncbi:MAG: signal peptidase I [Ruminococcaceae bacterium]|nr:signal peptidase I [Oscillospiraceae bacterium]
MLDEKELNFDTDNIIPEQNTDDSNIENITVGIDISAEDQDVTSDTESNETDIDDSADDCEARQDDNAESDASKTKKVLVSLLEYVEIFAFAVFAVLFLFSFAFRICVVDGDSMNNTLKNGEKLLTRDLFYSPKCGDIVVLHETGELNKPIVKRVIATEGQKIEIDHDNQTVKVDGKLLQEDYVYIMENGYKLFYGKTEITIPDGYVFVMGDNRLNSKDSRDPNIGCISEQQIMGKVIFRVSGLALYKVE